MGRNFSGEIPETFGEVLVGIRNRVGMLQPPTGDGFMEFSETLFERFPLTPDA